MKRYRVQFFTYNPSDLRKFDILVNEIVANFKTKKSAKEYGEKMVECLYGDEFQWEYNYRVRVAEY